jgi:hypothetical protein
VPARIWDRLSRYVGGLASTRYVARVGVGGIKGAGVSGEETAGDGHDSDDFIWIRTVRDDCAELYGIAAYPQEARLEPFSGTALKMI